MKLRYRGVDYKVIQPNQPTEVTPVTLTYRGSSYQSNQHQLVTQKNRNQQFIANRSPQSSLWKATVASPQLIYRGVAYTL